MAPLPDPSKTIAEQELTVLLAMLIFGEARGKMADAKAGVANVVRNRVLAGIYGRDWQGVILRPLQFSCFNQNDPNRKKLLEPLKYEKPETWESCYAIAKAILNGLGKDITQRATHYFDRSLDGHPPYWATGFTHTCDIEGVHFYRDPKAFRETHITVDMMGES